VKLEVSNISNEQSYNKQQKYHSARAGFAITESGKAGHIASFNPDPSGNRQFIEGAVCALMKIGK